MALKELAILLSARNTASGPVRKVTKDVSTLDRVASRAGRGVKTLGGNLKLLGTGAALAGVGLGIAAPFGHGDGAETRIPDFPGEARATEHHRPVRRPAALREGKRRRACRGHDVVDRDRSPHRLQAGLILRAMPSGVVGHEHHAIAGSDASRQELRHARHGRATPVDNPVEIHEQQHRRIVAGHAT